MAERRMFSKKIIDSDDFLELPLEVQSLYFHLVMRADDDGFINSPKRIARAIGATNKHLKMLDDKELIITFDSGIVAIKHWKIHNLIRYDRYKPTLFFEERSKLVCDEIGTYIMASDDVKQEISCSSNNFGNQMATNRQPSVNQMATNRQPSGNQLATNRQPNGNQLATQVRLGKDSIGKDSIDKDSTGKGSIEKNRLEEVSLGEGNINALPTPCENNKNDDFYLRGAYAPAITEEAMSGSERHLTKAPKSDFANQSSEGYNNKSEEFVSLRSPLYHPAGDHQNMKNASRISEEAAERSDADKIRKYSGDMYSVELSADNTRSSTVCKSEDASRACGGYDGDASADWAISPSPMVDNTDKLKPVRGPFGRGIVCLTDGQLSDLKERLGENQLNRYMDKLASFIYDKGARIKSHYDTIIKWHEEDSAAKERQSQQPLKYMDAQPSSYSRAERPRYGSFDPEEALQLAIKRSMEAK